MQTAVGVITKYRSRPLSKSLSRTWSLSRSISRFGAWARDRSLSRSLSLCGSGSRSFWSMSLPKSGSRSSGSWAGSG
jgi:hypothetical protein